MSVMDRIQDYKNVFSEWEYLNCLEADSNCALISVSNKNSCFHEFKVIKITNMISITKEVLNDSPVHYMNNRMCEYIKRNKLYGKAVPEYRLIPYHYSDRYGYDLLELMPFYGTLRNLFSTNIALPESAIYSIAIELCKELCELHEKKLVHGHISPENIYFDKKGNFFFGDIGFLHSEELFAEHQKKLSHSTGYSIPEVRSQKKLCSVKADVYSLGMVIYELGNTFYPPFEMKKGKPRAFSTAKRKSGKPFPRALALSPTFSSVIQKACAPDPRERYSSAKELLNALEKLDIYQALTNTLIDEILILADPEYSLPLYADKAISLQNIDPMEKLFIDTKAGDTIAMTGLGICYQCGIDIEKDEKKSFSLFERAANHGNIASAIIRDLSLLLGIGCQKDSSSLTNFINGYSYDFKTEKNELTFANALSQYLRDPDSVPSLLFQAFCYQKGLGVPEQKSKTIEILELLEKSGFCEAAFLRGIILLENPKKTLAKNLFTKVFDQSEDKTVKMLSAKIIGRIAKEAENYYEALKWYEKAFFQSEANSDRFELALLLGELATNSFEEKTIAKQWYQESLNNASSTTEKYLTILIIAEEEFNSEHYQQAIFWYKEGLSLAKDKKDISLINRNIAFCYHLIKEYSKAIEYYQEEYTKETDSEIKLSLCWSIARCYFDSGNYDEALKYFHHIYNNLITPEAKANVSYYIGKCFHLNKEYSQAILWYQDCYNAISSYETKSLSAFSISNCYSRLGDYDNSHIWTLIGEQPAPLD